MNLRHQLVFIALLTGIFFTSCSSKFSLQKRRYNKGFYFEKNTSKHNQRSDIYTVKSKKIEPLTEENKALNSKNEVIAASLENEGINSLKEKSEFSQTSKFKESLITYNEKKSKKSNQLIKGSYKNPLGFKKIENLKKGNSPFGMGDGGSLWGIVGVISALISIFFILFFLISIGAIFSGISGSGAILGPIIFIGIILVVLIALGVLFIINGD